MPNTPTTAVKITRAVALVSLAALIALCVGWELWWAPIRPGGSWLALKALPLLFPIAGIARLRMYTYRWTSLLVWLYFAEGLVRATSDRPPSSPLAWVEVVLSLVLFAACAAHVRVRQTQAAAAARA
jgi:uncharacterized membrane protein